jgi:hypothetical protein
MHCECEDRRVNWRVVRLLGVVVAVILIGVAARAQPAQSTSITPAPLVIGDFESGDFTGWTLFTSENGVLDAAVVPFDTGGLGATSYSARLAVGQATFEGFDVQRGGGIFRNVQLFRGGLSVSADVASEFPFGFCNGDGGTMQLLVDGVVVDEHSFGEICGPVVKHARLSGSVWFASAGTHEIRLLVTRAGTLSGVGNYLDNVVLSGTAVTNGAQQLVDLRTAVQGVGPGTSLGDKVANAQFALDTRDVPGTCAVLAAFINQVNAQSQKSIAATTAESLTIDATAIRALLGCLAPA